MALIKCKECGQEISDTSTICIHCGCPTNYQIKKSQTIITKVNQQTLNKVSLISIIVFSILLLIFLNKLFFYQNELLIFIIFILYLVSVFALHKCVGKNLTHGKRFIILETIMFSPILILIILNSKTIEWHYDNIRSLSSQNLEYVNLTTNILGKCKYYYDYIDSNNKSNNKNIYAGASDCSWKNDGNTYTFWIKSEEYGNTSFKCNYTANKLKCYLGYPTSNSYIYLEKK